MKQFNWNLLLSMAYQIIWGLTKILIRSLKEINTIFQLTLKYYLNPKNLQILESFYDFRNI